MIAYGVTYDNGNTFHTFYIAEHSISRARAILRNMPDSVGIVEIVEPDPDYFEPDIIGELSDEAYYLGTYPTRAIARAMMEG